MDRRIITRRILLATTTAGLLTLAACGSTPTTSKVETASITPSTTVAVASTEITTTAPITGGTAIAVASTATVLDPSLEKALTDAEALLGSNNQDLTDASTAAANGG